jgi:penicillin-binding protein 1A
VYAEFAESPTFGGIDLDQQPAPDPNAPADPNAPPPQQQGAQPQQQQQRQQLQNSLF